MNRLSWSLAVLYNAFYLPNSEAFQTALITTTIRNRAVPCSRHIPPKQLQPWPRSNLPTRSGPSFTFKRQFSSILSTRASSSTTDDEANPPFKLPTAIRLLRDVCILLVSYAFHVTVLCHNHAILFGGFLSVGYDSLVGCLIFLWYKLFLRRPSRTRPVPWNLPNSTDPGWNRFRISLLVTIFLLVKAYFYTGTISLFWEDMLYQMSASGWPITTPIFRALQVFLGHLSWVAIGTLILWVVPRPPPFFGSFRDFCWFQTKCKDSSSFFTSYSSSWLWWTIGGYFVSSWIFNVADSINQWFLPATVLASGAESVVTQLVSPENNDVVASMLGFLAPCLSAPVWEELLYRGFLLPGLSIVTGNGWLANFLQSIVFSAHHMSTTGALPLGVLGFAWATLYKRSGNLSVVMVVHSLWNARAFIGSWFGL